MIVNLMLYLVFCLQILATQSSNPCEIRKTCGECIRDSHLCKWCSIDDYNGIRCKSINDKFDNECDGKFIENHPSFGNITEDHPYNNVTQIKPQTYKMALRPGDSIDFNITYKGADNFPADLYFLLDVSTSMTKVKTTIAKAIKKIYDEMIKNTNNVHLGMGSFIDKNTAPFIDEIDRLNTTYSFRNQKKLTSDFGALTKAIENTPLGINRDDPEGGLDALAQVLACGNETIGWRKKSRKIVMFFTDEPSHLAGDGRVAGITQPYDGGCYTNENGIYYNELVMDYPSISIINKLAAEKEVTIIFVVKDDKLTHYDFHKNILGSKYIKFKTLNNDDVVFDESQLENVLSNIYKEISENIVLKMQMPVEDRQHIDITFNPNCTDELKLNPKCKVKHGEEQHFKGNVKLHRYYGKDQISINISLKGIEEKLTINIEVPGCNCEKDITRVQLNSPYCTYNGTKKCGICECNFNRVGDRCGCSATDIGTSTNVSTCRPGVVPKLSTETPGPDDVCSRRGRCVCGACKCQPGYEGVYCECNKNSCLNKCNGRGDCVCGKCSCRNGYTGNACECTNDPCKIVNGKTCNGQGKCECNKCRCNFPASWDARHDYTDDCVMRHCSDCHHRQCSLLQECAICYLNGDIEKCSSVCHGIAVNVTESIKPANDGSFICQNIRLDLGCYTQYQYKYDDVNYKMDLLVQNKSNCNESYYWYAGVSLLTLLIIGILTLVVWKVLTELRDRQEYNRFIKEHAADKDLKCVNPIYEPATTTFRNPAFRKRSVDNNLS